MFLESLHQFERHAEGGVKTVVVSISKFTSPDCIFASCDYELQYFPYKEVDSTYQSRTIVPRQVLFTDLYKAPEGLLNGGTDTTRVHTG